MNSAPDMTGQDKGVCRRAADRLVALVLALLLAFSFPVLSNGTEVSDSQITIAGAPAFAVPSSPDVSIVTPVAETFREFDRSRSGDFPTVLDSRPLAVRDVATAIGIVHVTCDTTVPGSAVTLPPGCGPPFRFSHA